MIRSSKDLIKAGVIESKDSVHIDLLQSVEDSFAVSITPQILNAIHTLDSTEDKQGLSVQFVPTVQELHITDEELKDPISDQPNSPLRGLVHRHRDRCLLMPVMVCPVYCRFCFRREKVSKTNGLSPDELKAAYQYISDHPEIWEVILTGGEPLILKPQKLAEIIATLEAIPHVEIIRIHTRVPMVDSERINEDMLQALKTKKTLYVAIHSNHPAEFTEPAKAAIARLVKTGIPLISQTVLLKGINDSTEIMGRLMRNFIKHKIKPYYLHHADLAQGTSHFRTTIETGKKIMKELREQYSGLCLPTYVIDSPDGKGKTPIW